LKFNEIVSRLTGFSSPIFGISWNPPESETNIARRIITQLEDKRVLYNPSEMEMPEHCVQSVLHIRHFLTAELGTIQKDSSLSKSIRAMRSACRKFLDSVGEEQRYRFSTSRGHFESWTFNSAIGELRGVFGIHLAQIASQHGLDIEDQLASILPLGDEITD
jgi:hypothetical protein